MLIRTRRICSFRLKIKRHIWVISPNLNPVLVVASSLCCLYPHIWICWDLWKPLGFGCVIINLEHLFSSFIPASSNLQWTFAGLPVSTLCWQQWPDTVSHFSRHVSCLSHCFRLPPQPPPPQQQQLSLFNWDWSNEQSAKFLRHVWQSVCVIKPKLAAPFSSSTADGPDAGTLLTAWQRMEGFCHDCLGYPLSFWPWDDAVSNWLIELVECIQMTLMFALNYASY